MISAGSNGASALVGCLMIGAGYGKACGVGPGSGRGVHLARCARGRAHRCRSRGGDERTLLGLAGYGDLLAAVEQPGSGPEMVLGAALGRGKTLDESKEGRSQAARIEALELIPRVVEWASAHKVKAPIFHALASGILAALPVSAVVHELMTGPVEGFV